MRCIVSDACLNGGHEEVLEGEEDEHFFLEVAQEVEFVSPDGFRGVEGGGTGLGFEDTSGLEVGDAVGDGGEDFGGLVVEEGVEFEACAAFREVVFEGIESGLLGFFEVGGIGGGGVPGLGVVVFDVVKEFALVGLSFFVEGLKGLDGFVV